MAKENTIISYNIKKALEKYHAITAHLRQIYLEVEGATQNLKSRQVKRLLFTSFLNARDNFQIAID